jgi:ABC-type nitrate/sulfonate/bicarbonate transport system substrate-binding protein
MKAIPGKDIFIIVLLLFTVHWTFATDAIKIQLKWEHQFQFAGYYMAIEKGFYSDLDLNVTIIEGNNFTDTVDSVLSGRAEIGISDSELLIQRNSGKPVVALLAIYQHSPLVFLSRKTNDIRYIHDIVGKRVMLETQSIELKAYLAKEGIKEENFILFPYQPNALIYNVEIDFMSAYLTDEPYLLKYNDIDYQVFTPQSAGIDFYGDILFTSDKFIRNNLNEVENFIQATKKGWLYALSNIDETIDVIYNKYSKHKDKEHLLFEAQESKKLISNDVVEIGYMFEGRWKHIGDTYVELGMLNSGFQVNKFIYSKKNYLKPNPLFYFLIGGGIVILVLLLIIISFGAKYSKLKFLIDKENE